jgi:hypothetical protein
VTRKLLESEREVQVLQPLVIAALNRIEGVGVFPNKRGKIPAPWGGYVEYGLVDGAADIIGCARGWFLAVETKSKTGRQAEAQKAFERWTLSKGGIYLMPRTEEEAVSGLLQELHRRGVRAHG